MITARAATDAEADTVNVYTGLLKPPPIKVTMAEVNEHLARHGRMTMERKKELGDRGMMFGRLEYQQFPSSCGTAIIHGFPFAFGGRININYHNGVMDVDATMDKSGYIVYLDNYIRDTVQGQQSKSYVMATLNDTQMKAGVSEVLVDYLGFSRLDDDFKNNSGANAIAIFGLCLSYFNKTNL